LTQTIGLANSPPKVGQSLTFVGFGLPTPFVKRTAPNNVAKVCPDSFVTGAVSTTTGLTCGGDSGSPVLSNGKIVGVHSGGDGTCRVFGLDARVDTYLSWIRSFKPSPFSTPAKTS